jgi:hypothetical protein
LFGIISVVKDGGGLSVGSGVGFSISAVDFLLGAGGVKMVGVYVPNIGFKNEGFN